jgi:hypothetical protein
MTDIIEPGQITGDGNLSLHRKSGVSISVYFQDNSGQPRDVVSRTYFMEIGSTVRVALINGPTSDIKIFKMTRAQVQSISDKVYDFVLLDETDGAEYSQDIWSGKAITRG